VAHNAFHGVRVPHHTFRVGVEAETVGAEHLPDDVTDVACGHLHPRQIVTVGAARVVCPGSTERTAFSEADQTKGHARWELGARWTVSFVDLPARPLVVVGTEADLDRVVPGAIVRAPDRLLREVRARGGWTRRVRQQLRLFA
jgi:DNA repair exonuclease SbcCD nuclease subunit